MPRTRTKSRKRINDEFIMREVTQWMNDHPDPDGKLDVDGMIRAFVDNNTIPDPKVSKFMRIKRRVCGAMSRHHEHDAELGMVRTIYPVRSEVQGQMVWEWAYGPLVHPEHVTKSLRQRYNGVEARIQHIERDRLYYNKTNQRGAELPAFDYDFNPLLQENNLAEMHGGEYPDTKPE